MLCYRQSLLFRLTRFVVRGDGFYTRRFIMLQSLFSVHGGDTAVYHVIMDRVRLNSNLLP